MKNIKYKIAAFLLGAKVYQFQGRSMNGEWKKGICILSPEAMNAHRVCFHSEAKVMSDTALMPSI